MTVAEACLSVPFCYACMYGRLRNAKLRCRAAHRGFIFYDVKSQVAGPLLNILFHEQQHSLGVFLVEYMHGTERI